jgi:hypothetical protein
VLLCNAPEAASSLLKGLSGALDQRRAEAMRGVRRIPGMQALQRSARYVDARAELDRFAAAQA